MIITTKRSATKESVASLISSLEEKGLSILNISGENYDVFGIVGDTSGLDISSLEANECVQSVQRIAVPFKKASRVFHPEDTIVSVGNIKIGGNEPIVIMGGPCSVEGEDQTLEVAEAVKSAGGKMLRGGAYKPRTSPLPLQGTYLPEVQMRTQSRTSEAIPILRHSCLLPPAQ